MFDKNIRTEGKNNVIKKSALIKINRFFLQKECVPMCLQRAKYEQAMFVNLSDFALF